MTIDVSLMLCTRDRGASLDRALASVTRAARAALGIAIEAIVVDNGSTDDTPGRARAWAARQAFPVHLVTEPRPGLSRARNAGLARATGRIVAMTDDDCVLHERYFTALADQFARQPGPIIIGGRILPGDPADLPVTIKLEDHAMIARPGAFPGGFVMGANLAFTRNVIDRVGLFDTRFGAGAPFVAAEDTDFLFRAMRRGVTLRYEPHFAVDHHHGRRRQAELEALLAGYSFGDGALYAKHLLHDATVLRFIARDIADLVRDILPLSRPYAGIRFFYLFRLRHKWRGARAYWRMARAARRRASAMVTPSAVV